MGHFPKIFPEMGSGKELVLLSFSFEKKKKQTIRL